MKKNAGLAAALNFLLFGAGYIYNGKRTGFGIALTVALVLLRYADISIFLGGQNRDFWYAMMVGLLVLQVAFAVDGYQEAKRISGDR